MWIFFIVLFYSIFTYKATETSISCRDRSTQLRQDGGLCFEIPPWQHLPVQLDHHLDVLKDRWGNDTVLRSLSRSAGTVLVNNEASRYLDTVLAPFLDTYHRNIQNSYQQFTAKILRRMKEEINAAVVKKQQIYANLTKLANELNIPDMCAEERRAARTIASEHVAKLYTCTEEARAAISKMGRYAEDMVAITRSHMEASVDTVARNLDLEIKISEKEQRTGITSCLQNLSQAAVRLGYELDLSLTNARRHNEQSCEKFTSCVYRARRYTEDSVNDLRDRMYQCVYA